MRSIAAILTFALLVLLGAATDARATIVFECKGKYRDGRTPTPDELQAILALHSEWLKAPARAADNPRKANLCGANLAGLKLRDVNLAKADLNQVNLAGAVVDSVDLTGAGLTSANLEGAHLYRVKLSKANLYAAHLSGSFYDEVDFEGANLIAVRLDGASLQRANLMHVNFSLAKLTAANFTEADLTGAILTGADLDGASLQRANLMHVNFSLAKLTAANFTEADLTGAILTRADLSAAIFELKYGSVPDVPNASGAIGLSELTFHNSPHAMVALREAFSKAGLRQQEREVTYAIKRAEVSKLSPIERGFNFVLFDVTVQYGMSPGRSLQILALLVLLFAPLYVIALCSPSDGGIWKVWASDRLPIEDGQDDPVRLSYRGTRLILPSLYFSLLSAFNIGWKEITVGSWIARVQPHEYALKATGWVRSASGIQSLLSVYLVALWALTYFGRPFE